MFKFLDTLYAIIASSIVLLIRTSQDSDTKYNFLEIWIFPIVIALIVYLGLQVITHFFKSINRPLKNDEGYWIETIEEPSKEEHDIYISILELSYVDNSYSIRGSTFLRNGDHIATWNAERTHLYDTKNRLLDYIYNSDINNEDFSTNNTRGYATIDFKYRRGYILDIMSENNKKQNFKLTNKINQVSDIEQLSFNKKLKKELIQFFTSK